MQIAIDGPAGAGKSTVAKAAAKELGFLYIDTGAMYRAVGLKAIRSGIAFEETERIEKMTSASDIGIKSEEDGQHIFLDGEDVTGLIRTPEVSMAASRVSAIGGVREALVALQRKIAGENNVIMDGRDIGTKVLPDAKVKIFLTASVEERAMRRYLEMKEKGAEADFEEVKRDMEQRDYNDTHRAFSPLRAAEDAVVIDTTGKSLEESVEMIKECIGRCDE